MEGLTIATAADTSDHGYPFEDVPTTPRGHFNLHFYAAVYQVISYVRFLNGMENGVQETAFQRYPFLARYLSECMQFMPADLTWEEGPVWWISQIEAWEHAYDGHLPLRALSDETGLSLESRLVLVAVGLVEEDSRFGTLFAELHAPLGHRRPSLELMGRIFAEAPLNQDPWAVCHPLLECGLVEVMNRDAPRSEWMLHVPEVLWEAARGETASGTASWFTFHDATSFPAIQELIFPASFLERVAQVPGLVQSRRAEAIFARGTRGSDRLRVLGAVARALDRSVVAVQGAVLEAHARLLGPLCMMRGALPVVTFDLTSGETVDVPDLPGYRGAMGFLLGFEGGLQGERVEKAVTLTLPFLRSSERMRHWQAGFEGQPVDHLETIIERFHLPGGYIRTVAATAISHAALDGRERITLRDVREARRMLNRQMLDTLADRLEIDMALADRLEHSDTWAHLIINETGRDKLRELEQRCRHRERVLDHLGPAFEGGANRGVRALFTGPSGTGKTLAAKLMAAKLGLDLYRVDLAAVINKYIGETEKNLHRIFSTAEELDVILLLDEGDSLLGSRTDVKSSNDRYANLETNYLLQRLENYEGIVLVTTNLGENIDRAFQRRMDISVDFLPPQAEERWQIWQLHLPEAHTVGEAFLEEVAVRCSLTGGQIRNAAMLASLLALEDGNVPVARHHLEEAVRSEYLKAGATCPLDHGMQPQRPPRNGVHAFLSTLQ